MKEKGKIFFSLLLVMGVMLLVTWSGTADASQWAKTYRLTGSESIFTSIDPTSDGGYIVAGGTWVTGAQYGNLLVLKLDSGGNITWQKTYGGTAGDSASSIQQTTDGGYIVAGATTSFGASGSDIWLLKLDSGGNITWQNKYGIPGDQGAISVEQTPGGGYIVLSEYAPVYYNTDILVLKLDSGGNIIWQKTYGYTDSDSAASIAATYKVISGGYVNDGYIVAGTTWLPNEFDYWDYQIWVIKLDESGNVTWSKYYPYVGFDEAISIRQINDVEYVVAGLRTFAGTQDDGWLLKLDLSGNVTWQGSIGTKAGTVYGNERPSYIQNTPDGGLIVVGRTNISGNADIWLVKYDAGMNVTWMKTYGATDFDDATSIQPTADGGYIVAGYTSSVGPVDQNLVLKLDASGEIPGCPLMGTPTIWGITTYITGWSLTPNVSAAPVTVSPTNAIVTNTAFTPSEICGAPGVPMVTIVATDNIATEAGPTTGTFTVSRTGSTAASLTVYYSVTGTSTGGVDRNALSGNLSIPAGSSSAPIIITPINDAVCESDETVILTLSANAAYTVGAPSSATVTIQDNDCGTTPTVSIVATDNIATEAGPTTGTFTVSRTGSTAASLTVYYSVTGTSTGGSDRNALSGNLSIPAGSSSATITITPINDTLVEGDETVVLTLSANAAYTVGAPSSATITIISND